MCFWLWKLSEFIFAVLVFSNIHRYVVFGRAPFYCPEMPFYVATVLVLCALCIAWWGLPKVVIDRRRQNKRYAKSVRSEKENVEAGGSDDEQVLWGELGRERLLPSTSKSADDERERRVERGASRVQHQSSPGMAEFVIDDGQGVSCTPENLRRLSQRSISFDLNETTTGIESPEELRAQRIERLLSV